MTNLRFGGLRASKSGTVRGRNRKISLEEFRRLGAASDCEEIDDLNEEPGMSAARLADDAHEFGKPGYEAVVADP